MKPFLEPCDLCMDFMPASYLKPSKFGQEGDIYCSTCRDHFKTENQKFEQHEQTK